MKKPYQELSITPLQLFTTGAVLQGSVVQAEAAVRTTGQVVNDVPFDDDTSFQQDWE